MIFAQEILAPFIVDAAQAASPLYARVDIRKNSDIESFLTLDHGNKTPVLFLPAENFHSSRVDAAFIADAVASHLSVVDTLVDAGITRCVIAVDNDGVLHRMISPRFRSEEVMLRARPLYDLYEDASNRIANVDVILTVEDLAPGGLDATDGIAIARGLQSAGLTEIIATAGSRDFLPLFDRRTTQTKRGVDVDDFISHEPTLASALWLLEHTSLRVSCCAFIDDKTDASKLAQQLGITMLIEKARIINA